jgi:tetratricopeptide (TPR) repeat protein
MNGPTQADPPSTPQDAPAQWPVRSGAPPALAGGFITRPETVPDLDAALVPGAAVVLASDRIRADGRRDWLGSCGKTQLAVSAAETMWRSGDLDLLVWITATSRASVLAGYLEAAGARPGRAARGDGESVATQFVRWLGETSRRWLVVIDDLSEGTVLDGLWPAGPAGTVLVTTADAATVPAERATLFLPVGVFSPREALGYLTGRLATDPDQRVGAADLIEDLGHEPLALAQASAAIASSAQSCREYRDLFARRREQMAGTDGVTPPPAAVTWTLCVDRADQLSPYAAQFLLMLGALLDGHEIPGEVFTTEATRQYLAQDGSEAADPRRTWHGVLSLERAGLLGVDPSGAGPEAGTVRMSPVVQAAVRAVIPVQDLHRAVSVAAAALQEVWPDAEPSPWLARNLRSSVVSQHGASQHGAGADALWSGGCHPLLSRAGQSLDDARLTGPAAAYWQELAETGGRILGPSHPDTLRTEQHLAAAQLAAGQPAEAVSSYRRVLAASVQVPGPDDPGVVAIQIGLGRALMASERPGDAVVVLGDVVATCERTRGAVHVDSLDARDELAAAYLAAQQVGEAIGAFGRTLADRERVQGPRHPDTVTTRQKLADAYLADGQLKAALAHYKRAVSAREKMAGPDHLDTVAARASLASAYYQAGRMPSALQLFQQTSADFERLLGPDHRRTLAQRASLANTYYSLGRLADAKTLLRDTADRCVRALPPDDPLTLALRESLGHMAGATG